MFRLTLTSGARDDGVSPDTDTELKNIAWKQGKPGSQVVELPQDIDTQLAEMVVITPRDDNTHFPRLAPDMSRLLTKYAGQTGASHVPPPPPAT